MAGCTDEQCSKEIGTLPLLTGCPADNEWFFVGNASGGFSTYGYGRRLFGDIKNCLLADFFGIGTKIITGAQLDGDNIYLNSDLINNLLVFYKGIPNYLDYGTQWEYVLNGDNNVVGIQILLGGTFTSEDVFLIIPNPQPV